MTPADIVARLRARATSEDVTEDRWRPKRPSYGGDRYQDELHAYAAEVLREEADAIEREAGPALPVLRTCGPCRHLDHIGSRAFVCTRGEPFEVQGVPDEKGQLRPPPPPERCPLRPAR